MPNSVVDAFGNTFQACSVSTAMKAGMPKQAWESEAEWSQSVKSGSWGVILGKISNGEIKQNYVIGTTSNGHKLIYKGGGLVQLKLKNGDSFYHTLNQFYDHLAFKNNDWDFGPNMDKISSKPAANGMTVSSTSTSTGALTNEEAATMFVKVKDKLAEEAGINIKGASGKLDELVYKTISDQTGYKPFEIQAKVDAYKATGKKLSALKKKVLPKSGNPTKEPTQKAVETATEAVKKEELKPEEVPEVWDDEAVAKAYISAKDHIVATNEKGWTLYTKNPDFDKAILKEIQGMLGPIKWETVETSLANYIANNKKLSVLKKQMIKSGELKAAADTLKKKKDKTDADKLTEEQSPPTPPEKVADIPADAPAPTETGSGQVGKATEDPTKIDEKQELTDQQKAEIKNYWENGDLPLSSSGQKLYNSAKLLANQYGFGDDVLPILRWVDAYKTEKFGYAPEQNKKLYETKVVEYLKNPAPAGYSPPYYSTPPSPPPQQSETHGEDPPDKDLFVEVRPEDMDVWARTEMRAPNAEQVQALKIYSGSTYQEINGHLRGFNAAGASIGTAIKNIRQAMVPSSRDFLARRGTSMRAIGMDSYEQLIQSIGKSFREPGFSSTAIGGSGQFSGEVNLEVQVPKGAKGVWLKPFSYISGENEYLLDAGTNFQILKVERVSGMYGGMTTKVTVRVIPSD